MPQRQFVIVAASMHANFAHWSRVAVERADAAGRRRGKPCQSPAWSRLKKLRCEPFPYFLELAAGDSFTCQMEVVLLKTNLLWIDYQVNNKHPGSITSK